MSTEFETLWQVATLEREQREQRAERNALLRAERQGAGVQSYRPRLHKVEIGPYRLVIFWSRA